MPGVGEVMRGKPRAEKILTKPGVQGFREITENCLWLESRMWVRVGRMPKNGTCQFKGFRLNTKVIPSTTKTSLPLQWEDLSESRIEQDSYSQAGQLDS